VLFWRLQGVLVGLKRHPEKEKKNSKNKDSSHYLIGTPKGQNPGSLY